MDNRYPINFNLSDNGFQMQIDEEFSNQSSNPVANHLLKKALDDEAQERQDNIAQVASDLAAEVQNRKTADNSLSDRIEAEADTRAQENSAQDTKIDANTAAISGINSKIPSTATASNKLVDEDFVNSSINSISAFYITYNAAGDPFPTHAALMSATQFYYAGSVRTPTKNDYCLVNRDETHDDAACRYVLQDDGNGNLVWAFQYLVNETPFTAAQLAAINSGITAAAVNKLSGLAEIKEVGDNLELTSNGILNATAQPVTLYDGPGQNTDGAMDQKATTDFVNAKRVFLTQAQYDALSEAQKNASDVVYYITDGNSPETTPADGSVTTQKIADGAVETDKIANGAVTSDKINFTTLGLPQYFYYGQVFSTTPTKHFDLPLYSDKNTYLLFGSYNAVPTSAGFLYLIIARIAGTPPSGITRIWDASGNMLTISNYSVSTVDGRNIASFDIGGTNLLYAQMSILGPAGGAYSI